MSDDNGLREYLRNLIEARDSQARELNQRIDEVTRLIASQEPA